MRVIEPRQQPKKPVRPKKSRPTFGKQAKLLFLAFGVFLGLATLAWWIDVKPNRSLTEAFFSSDSSPATSQQPKAKTIQTFTADGFKNLYETFAYPNAQEIQVPPSITGNTVADKRIRALAQDRGYQLRSVPVAPISKTNEKNLEGDDLLQPLALAGWQDLKAQAEADNVPLRLLSGYRSIAYQRELFVQRLSVAGAYTIDIANGVADAKVNAVLGTTAPPGYSRHHTGYTIDLACYPNDSFVAFVSSSCFAWLKKENYLKAKQTGWIPSYPEGASAQGPEPESWEYVWVGAEAVKD